MGGESILLKLQKDEKMIPKIFDLANKRVDHRDIARMFNVGTSTISRILAKRIYEDEFGEIYDKCEYKFKKKRRKKAEIEAQKSKQSSLLPDPKDQMIAELRQYNDSLERDNLMLRMKLTKFEEWLNNGKEICEG